MPQRELVAAFLRSTGSGANCVGGCIWAEPARAVNRSSGGLARSGGFRLGLHSPFFFFLTVLSISWRDRSSERRRMSQPGKQMCV